MATPIIQSVGATSGPGVNGTGRDDLVAGEVVTLSDEEGANLGASYLWEFEEYPIGTSPVMVDATTASPTFTVDADASLAGTYKVKCTVNGVESSTELLAVALATTGARIPAFEEEIEYDGDGNVKGWHTTQTKFMREVDQRLPQLDSTVVTRIALASAHSHNSDTPLIVGAFTIDPTIYDIPKATTVVEFVVIAAVGNSPLVAHASLYNLTDAEAVTSSLVTITDTTDPAEYAQVLTRGAGVNLLKNAARLYECRIYLDAAPGDPEVDTIELFSAELRVTQTIT